MDAIQLIKKDHRDIDHLFKKFERAARDDDRGEQDRVVRDLIRELSIHAAIEEELFYPALREAGAADHVLRSLEEHHIVKLTLDELDAMSAEDERFAPKVRVLAENVREHVEEEEREMLPRLRRALDAQQLRDLGESLATAKKVAPTRPHPAAPDTPPGNFVAGAVAAIYDRSRDAVRGATAMLEAVAERGARRGARAARGAASRAQERGRGAVEEMAQRGRETVRELRDRGRESVGRAERRGREAARRVRDTGRQAATKVKKAGRAATRGYGGETRPTMH